MQLDLAACRQPCRIRVVSGEERPERAKGIHNVPLEPWCPSIHPSFWSLSDFPLLSKMSQPTSLRRGEGQTVGVKFMDWGELGCRICFVRWICVVVESIRHCGIPMLGPLVFILLIYLRWAQSSQPTSSGEGGVNMWWERWRTSSTSTDTWLILFQTPLPCTGSTPHLDQRFSSNLVSETAKKIRNFQLKIRGTCRLPTSRKIQPWILRDPYWWVNQTCRSCYLQVFPWVYPQVTFVDPHLCSAL